jgi:hypothetical protein
MAKFDLELNKQYKRLEGRRAFWNWAADVGSLISAGRNLAMTGAFASMGLWPMAGMSFANALLSGAWFGVQRTPLQRVLSPKAQNSIRWGSIVLGSMLQFGVLAMSWRQAEQIADKKGPQGDAAVDKLEEFLNWIIDGLIEEEARVADNNDRPPLGDRA